MCPIHQLVCPRTVMQHFSIHGDQIRLANEHPRLHKSSRSGPVTAVAPTFVPGLHPNISSALSRPKWKLWLQIHAASLPMQKKLNKPPQRRIQYLNHNRGSINCNQYNCPEVLTIGLIFIRFVSFVDKLHKVPVWIRLS